MLYMTFSSVWMKKSKKEIYRPIKLEMKLEDVCKHFLAAWWSTVITSTILKQIHTQLRCVSANTNILSIKDLRENIKTFMNQILNLVSTLALLIKTPFALSDDWSGNQIFVLILRQSLCPSWSFFLWLGQNSHMLLDVFCLVYGRI